jgi:uncharacterized delta-60 repeat protein
MPSPASAAAGALDPTFSDDGKTTTTHVIDTDEIAEDVVVQPDGRIVVVGWRSDFDTGLSSTVVLRYLEDGTPDPGFGGGDGIVELPIGSARGLAVALLSDDRIAIAGTVQVDITDFDFAAFLLTPAGDLDSTFSGDGVSVISFGNDIDLAYGIDIDASDRLVLGGRVDDPFVGMRMAVVRLTPDGIPDPSFSLDGKRTIAFAGQAQARDVEVQSNGKIVLAGRRQATIGFALARLLSGGALDTAFGGDGRTVNKAGYGANTLSIQSDGKVVAAGYGLGSSIDFMLQRYRLNGSLDPTFSRDGIVRTNFSGFEDVAWDVEVQSNGKILAIGQVEVNRQLRFGVVRYRPSGIRDLTFSGDGKSSKVPGPAYGSTLDAADRLVAVGTIALGFGTARYLLN